MHNMDDLHTFYNLSDAANADLILAKIELLSQDYKVEYNYIESDYTLKIKDLDLSALELSSLIVSFEDNDVIPDYYLCDDQDDVMLYYDDYSEY